MKTVTVDAITEMAKDPVIQKFFELNFKFDEYCKSKNEEIRSCKLNDEQLVVSIIDEFDDIHNTPMTLSEMIDDKTKELSYIYVLDTEIVKRMTYKF